MKARAWRKHLFVVESTATATGTTGTGATAATTANGVGGSYGKTGTITGFDKINLNGTTGRE